MEPLPSIEDILEGRVGEGTSLDFKRSLGALDKSAKSDLVDDAVAFLNASGGNIIIGVAEEKNSKPWLMPMSGDPDSDAMRLQDILVTSIREKPAQLMVEPVQVDGGYLLCIRIGRNSKKPYCNAATGRYLQRRGRKNEPLLPGEVAALREARDRLIAELALRSGTRGDNDEQGFADGPKLSISILPLEHLDPERPSFEPYLRPRSLKGMTCVH